MQAFKREYEMVTNYFITRCDGELPASCTFCVFWAVLVPEAHLAGEYFFPRKSSMTSWPRGASPCSAQPQLIFVRTDFPAQNARSMQNPTVMQWPVLGFTWALELVSLGVYHLQKWPRWKAQWDAGVKILMCCFTYLECLFRFQECFFFCLCASISLIYNSLW